MKHLDKPTKEEYYAELVRRVDAGLFPSFGEDASTRLDCAYRGLDGRACGIGVVLPDAVAERMEGAGVGGFYEDIRECLPDWMTCDVAVRLQKCHDDVAYEYDYFKDPRRRFVWSKDAGREFLSLVRNVIDVGTA